ncbi:MAG: mechanosensitive ion channel [Pirellulaceae bacterium]|nr:mechanosensitive ion channel [Pirellulaceae bacterium]
MLRPSSWYDADGDHRSGAAWHLIRALSLAVVAAVGMSLQGSAEDASSTPDLTKSRTELASKRRELAERIGKLGSLAPPGQAKAGPADTTAELELLHSLDLIYQSHLSALDETAEQRRERDLRREDLRRSAETKATSGRPESWLVIEDYRDQLEAESSRARTCTHEITVAQDALQAAREEQDRTARTRRRLQEDLLSAGEPEVAPGERERRLKLAVLESAVADASVDLRRAELERHKTKQELLELSCRVLQDKVQQLVPHVTFSEEDLQSRLQAVANYEAELRRRLGEARQRLLELDTTVATSATRAAIAPAEPAAGEAAVPGPSLETSRMVRRLRQEEVEQLERWLTELAAGRIVPTQRFRLANNQVTPEEVTTWLANADKLMVMLAEEEQLLTARTAELMQDLTTLYRQARVAAEGDGSAAADQQVRKAALERSLQVAQSGQLHVKMLRRTGQRFVQELHDRGPGSARAAWWDRARDAVTAAWSYELAAVGDRPITVGKVVKGLVGLLCGVLLAAFVSRLLGKRVLPRLGLNPGASEALRSLTFYLLSAVFGLLSLELANVPLTALTFLGGAAAIAVGFASQDLVSNFMSGVILLAEQPIRVGDFVELGGVKGTVERIGTRSTRVRTDTNVEITVPNSKLLGGNVSNLTLSDNRVWSSVTVSVDRGLPVADIKDSLLAAVQLHPRVAVNPAPFVLFTDFGDKSLKFEVNFSIAMQHMTDARRIESDLREAIDAALREGGFTQGAAPPAVRPGSARPLDTPQVLDAVSSRRRAA